jgi:branched-chain amino acid transport system substrate-binding protein
MTKHRRLFAVLIAAVAALVAVSVAQPGQAPSAVTIGVVSDRSGPTAATQVPWLQGLEAYVRMVNDAGGIRGTKVNLAVKDDRYNPVLGLEAVKSLISDDHAPVVVGLNNSALLPSALPVIAQNDVVAITGQTTPKEITDPFNRNVFGVLCGFDQMADVGIAYQMAVLKRKNLRGVRVGVFALSVPSGAEWAKLIETRVRRLGGTFVGAQMIPPTSVNADVQAQSMLDQKPDFVALHGSPNAASQVLRAMDKYDFRVPVIGISAVIAEDVYKGTPYNTNRNFRGVHCFSPSYSKGKDAALLRSTGAKYGYESASINNVNFVNGWVTGQILVAGLRNANGNYSSTGIRRGLERIKNLRTGLSPAVTYSSDCHIGIRSARPYEWSFNKNRLLPNGTYEQWTKFVTLEYAAAGSCGKKR